MAVADDEGSCRGRIGAEPGGVGTGEHAGGAVGNVRPGGVGRVGGVPAIGGQLRVQPGDAASPEQAVVEVKIVGRFELRAQWWIEASECIGAQHHR